MAKKSAAKIKMEAAEIKRAAAVRREEKKKQSQTEISNGTAELDRYESLDGAWRGIGLSAPACHALVDDGLFELADLRKVPLAAIKELPGMSPNSIRVLVAEMKKADLAFRK
jgi:hypothetical protein